MAMLRNQVMSLIEHERIQTTDAKAKEIRSIAEKVITLGKRGDVHARRVAFRTVRSRELVAKVFGPLAERFRTRPGGYTRVLKIGQRVGDMAPVSLIELLPDPNQAPKAEKPVSKPVKAKPEAHDHQHDHDHDHDDHEHASEAKKKPAKKAAAKAPKAEKASSKGEKAPAKKKPTKK